MDADPIYWARKIGGSPGYFERWAKRTKRPPSRKGSGRIVHTPRRNPPGHPFTRWPWVSAKIHRRLRTSFYPLLILAGCATHPVEPPPTDAQVEAAADAVLDVKAQRAAGKTTITFPLDMRTKDGHEVRQIVPGATRLVALAAVVPPPTNSYGLQFAWTKATNAASYKFYQTAGTLFTPVLTTPGTVTNATVSGLVSNTTYRFYVAAVDVANRETPSNIVTNRESAVVVPPPVNTPPTLTPTPDKSVAWVKTWPGLTILLTVGDAHTAASNLVVTATSSKPAIVAQSGLTLSGSGATRTLRITPAPGKSGTVTITITVSDGNLQAKDSFQLVIPP